MEALYLLSYGSKNNQVTEAVNHFSCEANKIYYKEVWQEKQGFFKGFSYRITINTFALIFRYIIVSLI